MRCAEIQEQLPALSEERDVELGVRRHLSRCPDCRAELSHYESLRGRLAALSAVVVEPPPELLAGLVAIPRNASAFDFVRGHLSRNRAAYVGGAAVALAGAAAGTLVWRTRKGRLATT